MLHAQGGCLLADAYGAPSLAQQLRAPLECCSSYDADVHSARLSNGISRGGSGAAVDMAAAAGARGTLGWEGQLLQVQCHRLNRLKAWLV